jgi:hypothetical protein
MPRAVSAVSVAIAGLVALGFIGGIAYDPAPPRPEIHRAGYRVLEADFHAHTTFSDGSLTPIGLVRQAERRALDVVAVTEHNTAVPGRIARAWQRLAGGPVVVVGEEVTTARFHIIAVGLRHTVSPRPLAKDVIDEIHAQDGVAIAAHPVSRFWPALVPVRGMLDGSEVMHPLALSARGGGWRWAEAVRFYDESGPEPRPLAAIGSSDYHWGSVLGLCRTLVFVEEGAPPDEASVLRALRARRTVVVGTDGRLFGAPDLAAAIEREPIAPRAADYAYRGEGAGDRVLRAAGWLGIAALVLFGSRRRSDPKRDAAAADG